jgi:hypothetical protein
MIVILQIIAEKPHQPHVELDHDTAIVRQTQGLHIDLPPCLHEKLLEKKVCDRFQMNYKTTKSAGENTGLYSVNEHHNHKRNDYDE